MSKKAKSSIYHFENIYFALSSNAKTKQCFKNSLYQPPGPKKLHTIETKWDIRICCQAKILTLCSYTEVKGINV